MDLSVFDYELPPERIAQQPAGERDAARLLVLDRAGCGIAHRGVRDLPELLAPDDLLVFNDTRVVPARLRGRREATGGGVELLVLGPFAPGPADAVVSLVKCGGRLRAGERLALDAPGLHARIDARLPGEPGGRFALAFCDAAGAAIDTAELLARLDAHGEMPLPPYIRREGGGADPRARDDRERYQTVFAERPGAVAAPTAALHFTEELLAALGERGVATARITLHVGLGTFLPIRTERVEEHRMHAERYEIPEASLAAVERTRAAGGRVVAVGTTTVRTLEAWARTGAAAGETDIFIHPPFDFRVVGAFMTNFHLPRSTPLLMVSAFAGRERVLAAYADAIAAGYRFYSYGDAMLIVEDVALAATQRGQGFSGGW